MVNTTNVRNSRMGTSVFGANINLELQIGIILIFLGFCIFNMINRNKVLTDASSFHLMNPLRDRVRTYHAFKKAQYPE